MNNIVLPKGKYLVVDPCYVLKDEIYEALLETESTGTIKVMYSGNLPIVSMQIEHQSSEYPVYKYDDKIKICKPLINLCSDSGLLAIIPFELGHEIDEYDERVYNVIESDENITVAYGVYGNFFNFGEYFNFGGIIVDVSGCKEIEEYEPFHNLGYF